MKAPVQEQQKAETYTGTNLTLEFFSNFIDNSQIDNSRSQISEAPSIQMNYSVNQLQIKAFQMQNLVLIWSSVSKRQYIDRWIENKEYVKSLEKRTPQFMTKVFLKIFYTIAIKLQVKYSLTFRKIEKYAKNKPITQSKCMTVNMRLGITKLQQAYSRIVQKYFDECLKYYIFAKIYNIYEFKYQIIKMIDIVEHYLKVKLSSGWMRIQHFICFQNKLHILVGTINLTIHPSMREAFWHLRRKQFLFQSQKDSLANGKEDMQNHTNQQRSNKLLIKQPQNKTEYEPCYSRTKSKKMISLANLKRKKEENILRYQSQNFIKLTPSINIPLLTLSSRQISDHATYQRNVSQQNEQINKQQIIISDGTNCFKLEKEKKQKKQKKQQYKMSSPNSKKIDYYVDKASLFTKKYAQNVKRPTNQLASFRAKIQSINKKEEFRSRSSRSQLKNSKSIKAIKKKSLSKKQPNECSDDYQYFTTIKQKNKQKEKEKEKEKPTINNQKNSYFTLAKNKINKQNPLK